MAVVVTIENGFAEVGGGLVYFEASRDVYVYIRA